MNDAVIVALIAVGGTVLGALISPWTTPFFQNLFRKKEQMEEGRANVEIERIRRDSGYTNTAFLRIQQLEERLDRQREEITVLVRQQAELIADNKICNSRTALLEKQQEQNQGEILRLHTELEKTKCTVGQLTKSE